MRRRRFYASSLPRASRRKLTGNADILLVGERVR